MFNIDYWNYDDVDMIKIDVEGYEMRVLEGAHKTLTFNDENQSNVQYIMVELNHNTERYGSSSYEVKKHITEKTKAIVCIPMWAAPKMDEITKIAKENNLILIEDSAQALGAEFKGKKLGTFGDIGSFSFCFLFLLLPNMLEVSG